MKKNIYKEYLKKQKIKEKYDEEIVVNNENSFIKILFFYLKFL